MVLTIRQISMATIYKCRPKNLRNKFEFNFHFLFVLSVETKHEIEDFKTYIY